MTADIDSTLAALMPTERHFVMDLLEQAGLDVSPWRVTGDGKAVKTPRANPAYCYDWAFGNEAEGFVICVWHASLRPVSLPTGPAIAYQENIRDLALALDRIFIDRTQPGADRNRSRDQAKRARTFDRVLQLAFRRGLPVRMIVNQGNRRDLSELGRISSSVAQRKLDGENWYVHRYEALSGDVLLVRAVQRPFATPAAGAVSGGLADAPLVPVLLPEPASPAAMDPTPAPSGQPTSPEFVDQFSEPEAAAQREATVLIRERSAAVRQAVLRRGKGICELCGERGFATASGSIYLETHHVISLAEDGPDHETNVVAICPQDHRRAHFAAERDEISARLKAMLTAGGD
jgi:5-methylcytosine-specific restriction protein A